MADNANQHGPTYGLAARVARGLAWRGIGRAFDFGLQTAIGIALARLLSPRDFGLFAMARMVLGVAQVLREMGMGQALIQRRAITNAHVTAVFWGSLLVGVLLGATVVGVSSLVAAFFREPIVARVLKLMALGFVLNALGTVPASLLQRELGFYKLFVVDIAASLAYGTVGIALAYTGLGVWSLVWAMLGQESARLLILYAVHPFLPSGRCSISVARHLLPFTGGITGIGLVDYAATQIDSLIVGRSVSAAALGAYNRAYNLTVLPLLNAGSIVHPVLFPTFALIQEEPDRVLRTYQRCVHGVSLLLFPVIILLGITAPEFVPLVYGEQWRDTIAPLQIMCLGVGVRILTNPAPALFKGLGYVYPLLGRQCVYVALVTVGALLGTRAGIKGVAGAVSAAHVAYFLMTVHLSRRLIGIGLLGHLRAAGGPIAAAVAMGIVAFAARALGIAYHAASWLVLTLALFFGLIAYAVATRLILFAEMRSTGRQFWHAIAWHRKETMPLAAHEPTQTAPNGSQET